jgi:hypothetical protein
MGFMGFQGIGYRVQGIGVRGKGTTGFRIKEFILSLHSDTKTLRHFFHCRFAALPCGLWLEA